MLVGSTVQTNEMRAEHSEIKSPGTNRRIDVRFWNNYGVSVLQN